jgi:hypothetical protein
MPTYQQWWEMLDRFDRKEKPVFRLQRLLTEQLLTEYRERHPRAHRFSQEQFEQEHPGRYAQLCDEYVARLRAENARHDHRRASLVRALDRLAPICDLTPQFEMITVQRRESWCYASQTNPGEYARGALLYGQHLLDQHGFRTAIAQVPSFLGPRSGFDAPLGLGHDFELRANCTAWQFDAVMRLPRPRDEYAQVLCAHNFDPRVYNPYLLHSTVPWDF